MTQSRVPRGQRCSNWMISSFAQTGEPLVFGLLLTASGFMMFTAPPWSTKMMPLHLNMVCSHCHAEVSFGGGVASSLATIRLSPWQGREAMLKTTLSEGLHDLSSKPGLTSAHLLITDTPKTNSPTTEQQIRGADGAADWIVLPAGYDPDVVRDVVSKSFSSSQLPLIGAE
ncbi:hypothetical protein ACE103_25520 [Bradyrhizobium sp. ma5]|uniref:hypothetical protein n=1 Tax=Bradyrhizobium sp. ma5 TaxID=3344828 RepID=UPI0035D49F46